MVRANFLVLILMSTWAPYVFAEVLDPRFFANQDFQDKFPGASVLHPDSFDFIRESMSQTFLDGDALIAWVASDPELSELILGFSLLSPAKKILVMKRVFALEVRASGYLAPELVLDSTATRSAFFEFDPRHPGVGKVILNPDKLFGDSNPYAALLFLIHETRHSYQFQVAFDRPGEASGTLSKAYRLGFSAQRDIFDHGIRVSFCDFLTLNQEYEAFLFGNYVMEELTEGRVDTSDMGTLASQYVPSQGLRLDLQRLAKEVGSGSLLEAFNEIEKKQYAERETE